jgi:hypothetical protein
LCSDPSVSQHSISLAVEYVSIFNATLRTHILPMDKSEDDLYPIQHGSSIDKEQKPSRLGGERLMVVLCILTCEFCEQLTYCSVSANTVLFCQTVLDMSSDDALTVTLIFRGTYLSVSLSMYV